MVTRLDLPADLARSTVETTLWVRSRSRRWVPFVSTNGLRPPGRAGGRERSGTAGDPQVQSAFSIVESLGLGTIPPELKNAALPHGGRDREGTGHGPRAAISQDLNCLRAAGPRPAGRAAGAGAATQ